MPDRLSVASSSMSTPELLQLDGAVNAVVGGVRSMSNVGESLVVSLPASSRTLWVALSPTPSPPTVLLLGHGPSSPDSPSAQVQCTTTSSWYQPAPFGD